VFKYSVRKNWTLGQDTTQWWNSVCIWVIEEYGLPGDNYVTELSSDYMIFKFKEKEHAMITALRWGNDNE
jgi:hypothetical protein